MRSLTVSCGVVLLALAGTLAVGCEDDNSTGSPAEGGAGNEGGESGTGAKAGNTGAGGGDSNEAGQPGNVGGTGSGGEPGTSGGAPVGGETGSNGGEPGAIGGAGGAGGDPVDANLCENFPVTVTLGETIVAGQTGAVVCLDMCRVTTNTYSDGAGACAYTDTGPGFYASAGVGVTYRASLQGDWEWTSASAGTINQDFPYTLQDIPEDTEVTAEITAADDTEYTVVFTFEGGNQLTITSFTVN